MQHKYKEYNPKEHEVFKALTVKNPYAHWISTGLKTWEIRPRKTEHRGKLIITSSKWPILEGMDSGVLICEVEVVDCVMVKDLPETDWLFSCLPEHERKNYLYHYAWILKDPRPLIELPVVGNLGIWNLVLDKDELVKYPQELFHYSQSAQAGEFEKKLKRKGIRASLFMLGFFAAIIWLVLWWFTR